MALVLTDIDVGTVEGDGTGDKARIGAQAINANNALIEAAVDKAGITSYTFNLSDEGTDLTTGLKVSIRPLGFAFTLTEIRGGVTTAPTGSILIMDVHAGGTTIMDTDKISIDISEDTSETAETSPALTTTSIADDEKLEFYVDQIGSSVAGTGASVTLVGRLT
jgi:hypothetical protein